MRVSELVFLTVSSRHRDEDAHLAHVILVDESPLHSKFQRRVDRLEGKPLKVGDGGAGLGGASDALTTGLGVVQGEGDGDARDHTVNHSLQGGDFGIDREREAKLSRGVPLEDAGWQVAAASCDLDAGVVHFALTATIPNSNCGSQ